ncbi:hypothetical protein ACJJIQ_10060 [Microbulbifer sp. ANSA003]|uniref:hypothetical protein n=1 Tax=Microbulbifer sp. ANSA003 TaxID=3243360 RepID=UPI0040425167
MKEITFETDVFTLTEEKDNFINPCCFGEDAADWFKPQMESAGIEVLDTYQEDWGWEISCSFKGNKYFIGLGGTPETEGKNNGEWRVMVTKPRSIVQVLTGKNKLSDEESILGVLSGIITKAGFSNVSTCSA